jgi:CheY-like chemotaxis protein
MSSRIIVLDQDQTLHSQYCALLEGEGYAVKCYASLPDPQTVLLQRPSLILLDYFVGTTAYGWIWLITLRTYAEEDIPVLVCTANSLSLRTHAQDLMDLEAKLLPKPWTAQDLLQAVHQHAAKPASVAPVC